MSHKLVLSKIRWKIIKMSRDLCLNGLWTWKNGWGPCLIVWALFLTLRCSQYFSFFWSSLISFVHLSIFLKFLCLRFIISLVIFLHVSGRVLPKLCWLFLIKVSQNIRAFVWKSNCFLRKWNNYRTGKTFNKVMNLVKKKK